MKSSLRQSNNLLTISVVLVALIGGAVLSNGIRGAKAKQAALATLPAIPTATCTPAPSGMISWWPGDTDAKDLKGSNDGTLQGGATAGVATGEVGNAFNFVSVNSQYVSINDDVSLHPSNLTIDAWLNFNAADGVRVIVSKGLLGGSADSYVVYYYNNALRGATCDGAFYTSSCTEVAYPWSPALGVWYHIAYTFDGSTHKLFVDGDEVATGANTRTPAYDSTEVRIGADLDPEGLYPFDGKIDEVEFFNRALPASDIANIFNAGSAGNCKITPTGISDVSGTGTFGGTATLTATLGANNSPLSGKTVSFKLNNAAVCDTAGKPACPTTDGSGFATLTGVDLTGIDAGNYNNAVLASFAADGTYDASTANGTLTVNRKDQTITIDPVTHAPSTANYNSQFTVAATSDSGLAVTFNSAGSCTNSGAVFTMTSGTGTCTVKYDVAQSTNYNAAPQKTETVTAQKISQTIAVNTHAPANANYNSQFNVAATAPSSAGITYSSSGSCSNSGATFTMTSGTGTCTVMYDSAPDNNYNAAPQISETVNAQKLNQTITFDPNPLPDRTFGESDFGVNASSDSNLSVSFAASGNCSVSSGAVHLTGAGSCTITASQAGDPNYHLAADVQRPFNIAKGIPVITWNNPADIVYGAALSATQLNATALVAGTNFVYTPVSGTVLHAGANQTLHVDFTPDDTTNYNNAAKDVHLNVTKATLTITADDKSKSYRAANPALTYTPSGFVNGDTSSILSGAPNVSTTATATSAVNGYAITITQGTLSAQHGGFDDYSFNFVNGTLTINKATPVINWNNPADVVYGTALSGAQLNAVATNPNDGSSVAGIFSYNPAGGAVLHVGNGQVLATNFAPTETNNYNAPAQKTVAVNVNPATLTITADNKARPLNTANPPLTFTPAGFVNGDNASVLSGAANMSTTAIQSSPVGDYPINITQGTLSASDYIFNFVDGTLAVGKTAPVINWSNPADVVYGTALSATQLNATATDPNTNAAVAGTFTYTPAVGTVLHVGNNQALSVTFAPTDTTNYVAPAQKLVSINVTKATLTITADNKAKSYRAANPALTFTPSGFVNGDSASVLTGTPSLNTTAIAASVVNSYPVSVSHGTLNANDYAFNFVAGTLSVNKATPVINWNNPADIVYGNALSGTQLNATATNPNDGSVIAGAFAYNPAGTTVLHSGNGQTLRGDFTPNGADASSYNPPGQKTVSINVLKATLTITADNKSKAFGAANPTLTFTPVGFVNADTASVLSGTPSLSTTAANNSAAGNYPITIAQGTLAASDYAFNFINGTLTVGKTAPVINWSNPADIVYGTALGNTQLNATATDPNTNAVVTGTFTYGPAANAVLHVGSGQTLAVNFSPTDTANYSAPSQKTVAINVLKKTLTVAADDKSKTYRQANPALTFSVSGFVNGDSAAVLSGAPAISTAATTTSNAGGYAVTPAQGTLSASDYVFGFVNGTLTINKATPVISWNNPADITFGSTLGVTQLNAIAANPNDGSNVAGTFTYNPASGAVPNAGNNQILSANFAPTDTANYNAPTQKTVTINVLKADQTITFGALANKVFGDASFALSATTAPSGLPVTFSILSGPATINGNNITITGAGQVIVHAAQPGNSNYNAAPSTDQSFLVASAPVVPINGRFVFGDRDSNNVGSIFLMNADGSKLKKLTLPESYFPAWSPDGTKVMFSARRSSNPNIRLSMMKADGTNVLDLTAYEPAQQADGSKAWSPDGQWIAWACDASGLGFGVLCVRKVDDPYYTIGPPRGITHSVDSPSWSPDSKKIVYAANEGLYVYDLVLNSETQLIGSGSYTPNWSPDGTRILFARSTGIWVMNVDGSNQRQLTTGSAFSPKWSLDMKQIAFVSNNSIFVMNADGTSQTKIYTGTSILGFDWQLAPLSVPTQTGSGARVADGPVNLTFSNVGTAGTTSVIPITPSSAGTLTGGFAIDGNSVAFDVTTTAKYTAPIEVCFNVPPVSGETAAQFNARRVMHGEGGVLVDRTSRHDFAAHSICANVNSLSPFAIATNLNPPATNEIDDPTRFVEQHYLDFLERSPDTAGLNFWTATITSCGPTQSCTEVKRINASAAFFLSIEFQQEGYLVERTYKAAYGDAAEASTLNGAHQMAVPIMRFNQFLSDTAEVGQGVVVNQGNWQQQLDANKDAFMLDFVQRQGFIDAYPMTLTPTQFVNQLFTNAGVTPTAAELSTAVGRFGGAANSADASARAKALRDVSENPVLMNAEMNRAFVLMEYFGYLRRNPNEGSDTDYTGYDFWLTKLNQFNGDFARAEMVKAFISSIEYRQRFGP